MTTSAGAKVDLRASAEELLKLHAGASGVEALKEEAAKLREALKVEGEEIEARDVATEKCLEEIAGLREERAAGREKLKELSTRLQGLRNEVAKSLSLKEQFTDLRDKLRVSAVTFAAQAKSLRSETEHLKAHEVLEKEVAALEAEKLDRHIARMTEACCTRLKAIIASANCEEDAKAIADHSQELVSRYNQRRAQWREAHIETEVKKLNVEMLESAVRNEKARHQQLVEDVQEERRLLAEAKEQLNATAVASAELAEQEAAAKTMCQKNAEKKDAIEARLSAIVAGYKEQAQELDDKIKATAERAEQLSYNQIAAKCDEDAAALDAQIRQRQLAQAKVAEVLQLGPRLKALKTKEEKGCEETEHQVAQMQKELQAKQASHNASQLKEEEEIQRRLEMLWGLKAAVVEKEEDNSRVVLRREQQEGYCVVLSSFEKGVAVLKEARRSTSSRSPGVSNGAAAPGADNGKIVRRTSIQDPVATAVGGEEVFDDAVQQRTRETPEPRPRGGSVLKHHSKRSGTSGSSKHPKKRHLLQTGKKSGLMHDLFDSQPRLDNDTLSDMSSLFNERINYGRSGSSGKPAPKSWMENF